MEAISVHVPKTAGSSFGTLLATIYGEERIYKDYGDVPMNPRSRYKADHAGWRASASAEVGAIGPEFRAVHGHFAVEKYDGAFAEARRIAWVRHPASWVISLYYFWKHVPTTTHPLVRRLHSEGLSLDEFAQDPAARDQVSGVFLKGSPPEAFDFLGVQEHFEDDFRDLARLMEWGEVDTCRDNPSPEPLYRDRVREHHEDRRLIDRLVSLNETDMALYEVALRFRTTRLEQNRARAERHARKFAIRSNDRRDRSPQQAGTA